MVVSMNENSHWYIDSIEDGGEPRSTPIFDTPFVIGRGFDCNLRIVTKGVSRRHAAISIRGEKAFIKDLGSRNGTYVNLDQIEEREIDDHDVLHFGSQEFRLSKKQVTPLSKNKEFSTQVPLVRALAGDDLGYQLDQLIDNRMIECHFQPIVDANSESVFAYEALCRGNHEGLPTAPGHLLNLARHHGKSVQCSELFRDQSARAYSSSLLSKLLFVNAHPDEVELASLVVGLQKLLYENSGLNLVLDIHAEMGGVGFRSELHSALDEMGIRLAYDDFKGNEAQFESLMAAPPDYLKFDLSIIKDIDTTPASQREVLARQITTAHCLGVLCIAEGVETAEQAIVCKELGFDLFQGFHFGMPAAKFS